MTHSRAVLGAVAVLFLAGVLLWGAGSGGPLVSAPGVDLPDGTVVIDEAAATPLPSTPAADPGTEDDGDGINAALIAQVAIAALIAWLVLRWFRNHEPDEPSAFVDDKPSDELALLVQATSGGSDALDVDRDAEPRNAVVACWVALEDALVSAGEAPQAGETSFDVTQRVLSRWNVDPEPLRALGNLFREARFSRHPITGEHADRAGSALEQIHTGLARAAARRDQATAARAGDNDNSMSERSAEERDGKPSAGMP